MGKKTDSKIGKELNSEASKGVRASTSFLSRGAKALTNLSKKAVKTANKVAKKFAKKSLWQLFLLIPFPIKIAIAFLIVLAFIILCIQNENPDAVTIYEDATANSTSISEEHYYNPPVLPKEIPVQRPNEGNYLHSDFLDEDGTLSEATEEELTYEGEDALTDEVSRILYDYIRFFKDLFTYVYETLAKNEVERMMIERNYNPEATYSSYYDENSSYMDYINYAELISIMSQNPEMSWENATMESIKQYLTSEETNTKLQNLFSIYAEEKIGANTLFSRTKTSKESIDSESFESHVGEVTDEYIFFNISPNTNEFKLMLNNKEFDYSDYVKYCTEHQDEVLEDDTLHGYVTNGRTIIKISEQKPSFKIQTTITKQYVKKEEHEYKILKSTPAIEAKKKAMLNPHGFSDDDYETITETKYYLITESTQEVLWEYRYAEMKILPYCLSDLFQVFGISADEYNITHPTVENIDVLNEQEKFIRQRASDIDFGKSERTDFYTPYESILKGVVSSDALMIQQSLLTQMSLSSEWQKNLMEVCKSRIGIKYGTAYNGYKQYVCCSFVHDVFKKIGITICPDMLSEDDIERLKSGDAKSGVSGKLGSNLYYSCTLMAYYYRHYQEQACLYTNDVSKWQVGDIVFISQGIEAGDKIYNSTYVSKSSNQGYGDYSSHVFIYLGDGIMVEQVGGIYGRVTTRKLQQSYLDTTWFVLRPSLLH